MDRKTTLVFRGLAVITALQAVAGLFLVSLGLSSYTTTRASFGADYPYFGLIYVALTAVNVSVLVLLFTSALRIWRLQRRGLFLLVLTLCFEFAYFAALTIANTNMQRDELSMAGAVLIGTGMMALVPQLFTAYPLIALVLLMLAYRYVGIPARAPLEPNAGAGKA